MHPPTVTTSPTSPTPVSHYWRDFKLEENEAIRWKVGTFVLYAQSIHDDLMLAQSTAASGAPTDIQYGLTSHLPLHLAWKRWALDRRANTIRITPTLPDRSLVVKTRSPVIVLPNSTVSLYVSLPIWVEVLEQHKNEYITLERFCPQQMSNTWYGDHLAGELCYALKSRARRAREDLAEEPFRAICRFTTHNRSNEALPMEKIRVVPNHLGIFRSQSQLWTSSINVDFRGRNEPSRVSYEHTPPSEARNAASVREPRVPFRESSLLDSFVFKSLFNSI